MRCLPSPEQIPLRCVPACGEDFARSIPSGSPHKAKGRLCGGPGEVGLRPNGAFLRCPHLALPRTARRGRTPRPARSAGIFPPCAARADTGPYTAQHGGVTGVTAVTGVSACRFPVIPVTAVTDDVEQTAVPSPTAGDVDTGLVQFRDKPHQLFCQRGREHLLPRGLFQ